MLSKKEKVIYDQLWEDLKTTALAQQGTFTDDLISASFQGGELMEGEINSILPIFIQGYLNDPLEQTHYYRLLNSLNIRHVVTMVTAAVSRDKVANDVIFDDLACLIAITRYKQADRLNWENLLDSLPTVNHVYMGYLAIPVADKERLILQGFLPKACVVEEMTMEDFLSNIESIMGHYNTYLETGVIPTPADEFDFARTAVKSYADAIEAYL